MNELKQQYGNKVNFETVNESNPAGEKICAQYNVNSFPDYRILDSAGNVVDLGSEPPLEQTKDTESFRKAYREYLKAGLEKVTAGQGGQN